MIGEEFDGYRVEQRLGEGGMAVVYRAFHMGLRRPVALKVMRPHSARPDEMRQRFRREYEAMAALSSPHLIKLFDVGTRGDLEYFTMELIEGPTLMQAMQSAGYPGTRWPAARAVAIVSELLEGLAACHEAGVLHRDVKPDNIFLHPERGTVLGDFGLVRLAERTQLTETGRTAGTVLYMSPEQVTGKPLTPATDLYAAGLVLFELLAGRGPFTAETPVEMMGAHAGDIAPRVSEFQRGTPARLDELVASALAKDPRERPASARAMRSSLSACLAPDAPRRRTGSAAVVARPAPRSTLRWAVPAVALAAAAALAALAPWRARKNFEPQHLEVRAGLRSAHVEFDTADTGTPVLEWRSAGATPATTALTEPAQHHEADLRGLSPGTEYRLRVVAPGNDRDRVTVFRTREVGLHGIAVTRGVDTAEVTLHTDDPVRLLVSYWPASGASTGNRQSRRAQGAPATDHRVVLDQLDPELAYTVRVGFVNEDLEDDRAPDLQVPSTATILTDLLARVKAFDVARVVSTMQSLLLRHREPAALKAEARRTLGPYFAELGAIAKPFVPLSARFFGSSNVFLREKMRVYAVLALADHLDRLCQKYGVPLSTGLARADRGPLTLRFTETLARPEVLPIPIPEPRTFMNLDQTLGDAAYFDHRRRADLTFAVTDLDTIRRAELVLDLVGLRPEQYFELRVNDAADLVMPGVEPPDDRMPKHYFHQLAPGLLVAGTNRLTITLRTVPGLLCAETPYVEAAALHLER